MGRRYDAKPNVRRIERMVDLKAELPTEGFVDRVMAAVARPEGGDARQHGHRAPRNRVRIELWHGITAAAFTYILIQSGIVGQLATVEWRISQLIHSIAHFSERWLS